MLANPIHTAHAHEFGAGTGPFSDPEMTGTMFDFSDVGGTNILAQDQSFLQTPTRDTYVDPFQPSNVRQGAEGGNDGAVGASAGANDLLDQASAPANMPDGAANQLEPPIQFDSLPTATYDNDNAILSEDNFVFDPPTFDADDDIFKSQGEIMPPESEPDKPNLEKMKAFAQLVFPDGQYLIHTTSVTLGRNAEMHRQFAQQQKRAKRMQAQEEEEAMQRRAAEEALSQYQNEPSQPSQHGEDPLADASSSLEGRPAPALRSNFSVEGGIFSIPPEDEELGFRKSKKKRSRLLSRQSSSTTSVIPANLHTYNYQESEIENDEDVDEIDKPLFVKVHTSKPEDIMSLSRAHLRFQYNRETLQWELEVLGNGAFVKNEHCYDDSTISDDDWTTAGPKMVERGEIVPLTHNTEIIVSTLIVMFKLPQERGPSTMYDSDDEDGSPLSTTSAARRFSGAMDAVPTSDDRADELDEDKSKHKAKKDKQDKKPRVTLKLGKQKKAEPDPSPAKKSPEVAKKPEKGKKPAKTVQPPVSEAQAKEDQELADKVALLQQDNSRPSETPVSAVPTPSQPAKPEQPLVFEPGTLLAEVPQEHLPEKRKGPGRPPKNGLISKRDLGIIRRKQKEYEKQGLVPPHLDELVKMVRAENKQKEAAAKAAARGEAPPPVPSGFQVMQSIETDYQPASSMPIDPAMTSAAPVPNKTVTAGIDGISAEAENRATSPKRQRTYRSPSPMKPKEECTEEELKKPNHTYYTTLDEILSEGPPEGLELQQIYDKICKKYPYYKYGLEGNGWQSSVRHNLKQHERFQQVSKQGKGWLWAINYDIPFDKEKKRKPTPPPVPQRPPMPYHMQNGMQPQYYPQYGQPGPNGQPQYQQQPQSGNAQAQYASPYGQPGQYGPPPAQQGAAPPGYPAAGTQQAQYPYPVCYYPTLYHYRGAYFVRKTDIYLQPQQSGQPPAWPQQQNQPPTAAQHAAQQQRGTSRQTSEGGTPHPHPGFNNLVEEIMDYRTKFLRPHVQDQSSPAYALHEGVFKKCVDWISELQGNGTPQISFASELERKVFTDLERIMRKYQQPKEQAPGAATAPGTNAAPSAQPTTTAQGQQPAVSAPAPGPVQAAAATEGAQAQAQQQQNTQLAAPNGRASQASVPNAQAAVAQPPNGPAANFAPQRMPQQPSAPTSQPALEGLDSIQAFNASADNSRANSNVQAPQNGLPLPPASPVNHSRPGSAVQAPTHGLPMSSAQPSANSRPSSAVHAPSHGLPMHASQPLDASRLQSTAPVALQTGPPPPASQMAQSDAPIASSQVANPANAPPAATATATHGHSPAPPTAQASRPPSVVQAPQPAPNSNGPASAITTAQPTQSSATALVAEQSTTSAATDAASSGSTVTAPAHTDSKPSPAIANVESSQPPSAPRPESAAGVKRSAPSDESTLATHEQNSERDVKRAKTDSEQSEAKPAA